MLKLTFDSLKISTSGAVVLAVGAKCALGASGATLDKQLGGFLKKAMEESSFKGEKDQTLAVVAPANTKLTRIILIGTGEPKDITLQTMERLGGQALAALKNGKDERATFLLDQHKDMTLSAGECAAHVALGARLGFYTFEKYKTKKKPEDKAALHTMVIGCEDSTAARRVYAALDNVAEGVFFARDLVTEPANILYPEVLATRCLELRRLGVKVEVLDEKALTKLGMGALLGVAQGSERPPRVVVMQWNGAPSAKDKRPLAFVGKGVTFDTGGISLKPGEGMEKMKSDMAGSAAVIGAMKALAGRKAKANVVGIVGLVENMPSGCAQRPGDVVTSMSGQTIEVLNTDAEGRLVLADIVWYAQEKFNPRGIVDLATLTGAISIALGSEYAGLFSNDDKLSDQLIKAGQATGETLWRFPMGEVYDKTLDSPIADMKNISGNREAGSITGAQFIGRFVKKGVPWAHLDIAGVAWSFKDRPTTPKGATAFGVRLLDELAMSLPC